MKQNLGTFSITVVSAALIALARVPALAQQEPARAASPPARLLPAGQVLGEIGRNAGVVVLADSTVFGRAPLPATAATPETVDQQIAEVVQALPAGTTWAKLYVPAPENGRWNGDVVANYARSLAQLVGTVGRAAPAGTVEILGRHIPADRASDTIAALNLKLVYLVTNPRAPAASAVVSSAANWPRMTSAQRDLFAQQQAQRLLALTPDARLQAMSQLMQEESPQQAIMHALMLQLPDNERVQLKQNLAGVRVLPPGSVIKLAPKE